MKTITQNIKFLILVSILTVGVRISMAGYNVAPANPPSNNTDAPINVGSSVQSKLGAFVVGSTTVSTSYYKFQVYGNAYFDSLAAGAGNFGGVNGVYIGLPTEGLYANATDGYSIRAKNDSYALNGISFQTYAGVSKTMTIKPVAARTKVYNSVTRLWSYVNSTSTLVSLGKTTSVDTAATLDVYGSVKIKGSSPTVGKVLFSTNTSGDSQWSFVNANILSGVAVRVINCTNQNNRTKNTGALYCPSTYPVLCGVSLSTDNEWDMTGLYCGQLSL